MTLPALQPTGWESRTEAHAEANKSNVALRTTLSISPAIATRFQLSWANEDEKLWLDAEMGRLGRQRMNIRSMPQARFVLLKDESGKIAGWGGVDTSHDLRYPELFSLHVDPKYRKFSLGLLLTSSRATFLKARGFRHAYLRVTRETTSVLLRKQLESKYYSELNPRDLDPNYLSLCGQCELFGRACREQVFLRFDVEGFLNESEREIGPIDLSRFPQGFSLSPSIDHVAASEATFERPTAPSTDTLHEPRVRRLFRPVWLA